MGKYCHNIAKINRYDCANGKGIRVSVFVAGCPHKCPNCFNSEFWAYNSGDPVNDEKIETIINYVKSPNVAGLSILGGEPLVENNIETTLKIVRAVKDIPDKDIWLWSGYTYEELLDKSKKSKLKTYSEYFNEIINNIAVLIDGKFIEEKKDLSLFYRGSSNQRVIDIPKTLKNSEVVLYHK